MCYKTKKTSKDKKKELSLHKSKSRQASIQSMLKVQPFSKDSAKHKVITSKLAVLVATANVAYHIVENFEFRELLSELEYVTLHLEEV